MGALHGVGKVFTIIGSIWMLLSGGYTFILYGVEFFFFTGLGILLLGCLFMLIDRSPNKKKKRKVAPEEVEEICEMCKNGSIRIKIQGGQGEVIKELRPPSENESRYCPKCGNWFDTSQFSCPNCGCSLNPSNVCPECGRVVNEYYKE